MQGTMMSGPESLLIVLAILAVGAFLTVPVFLVVLMVKLLRRHDEAAQRTSGQFKSLQDNLREQQRMLREILDREPLVPPKRPPAAKPVSPVVEAFTEKAASAPHDEPAIMAGSLPPPTDPTPPAAAAESPTEVAAAAGTERSSPPVGPPPEPFTGAAPAYARGSRVTAEYSPRQPGR